jgi:hypothetical protein
MEAAAAGVGGVPLDLTDHAAGAGGGRVHMLEALVAASLADLVPAALAHAALALLPRAAPQLLPAAPALAALGHAVLEDRALRAHGASLAEHMYGLCRDGGAPPPLLRRQRLSSLVALVRDPVAD